MKLYRYIFILLFFSLLNCSSLHETSYYLPNDSRRVYTGLENFMVNYAEDYEGKKAILITNHSGVNFFLNSNILLLKRLGIDIDIVLAPEHGIYGFNENYSKRKYIKDKYLGITIFNMHKLSLKMVRSILKKGDFVIFDIQDMGMRCYTYISNLKLIMDALNGTKKELVLLDRPNPISFLGTDGSYLERSFRSRFVSAFPAPLFYNMTLGEAALYYNGEFKKRVNLKVVELKNYDRDVYFNETGLPWIPPSPNLPNYESAILYSVMVMFESINLSLGRGTAKPFEYFGAPWIDPVKFVEGLRKLNLRNFRFRAVYFKPTFSDYKNKKCGGAQIFYTGGEFSPVKVSYKILQFILKNYKKVKWNRYKVKYSVDFLAGTDKYRKSIDAGKPYEYFYEKILPGLKRYNRVRDKYLLY